MRVLFYRLFRLRRLIGVSILLPLLIIGAIAALKGPAAVAFVPFAVLVPLAHVLRYPTSWMETLAVSCTLSVLLALAGMIGADVSIAGLVVRMIGLAVLGFGLFMMFVTLVPNVTEVGAAKPITIRARRTSTLDAETLKAKIALYPGRVDDKVICGPAGDDGVFEITYKHRMDGFLEFAGDNGDVTDKDLKSMGFSRAQFDEMTATDPNAFDITFNAVVVASTPQTHDIIAIEPQGSDTTATRYSFESKKNGTIITMQERTPPMAGGMRFGFWLQDYIADFLTDEVDRAEGRAPRANRFSDQSQLIVDIARWFVPHAAQNGAP
ncbi:MAG: hypothetical protein AAFN59_07760 [Pseudomonadota bacterium]